MKKSTPKLPLTSEERMNLRKCKVKLNEIALMDIQQLTACLQSTYERAKYLRGLAQFQAIPSIGPKLAQWVTELGYYSLEELKNKDGADLTNRLEEQFGYWEDPCVEDSLRCIVHHANYSNSEKSWWHFTDERKQYRELNGYPDSRPTTPWHDKKAKS
ncbi:MAG: helix-hairpin-helix domain-containing protein [Solibacillus sp.]|uniref:helix-hairpin-helix domain-containing protein n=1 Tax=Solibacillus sp. TaxID=1909654 RepID=UPI0033151174